MNRFSSVALACAFTFSATGAFAAAESTASLSNLRFQVIDLNPADGAAINFVGGSTQLSMSVSDGAAGESDGYSRTRNGLFAFTQQFESDLTNASGSAAMTSQAIELAGSATGLSTSYSASAATGASAPYYYYDLPAVLSLSAQSMVIITVDANVFASATNPAACPGYYYYGCSASESASASVSMSMNYSYSSANGSVNYSFNDTLGVSSLARGEYTQEVFQGYEYIYYDYGNGYGYTYYQPVYSYIVQPELEETKSGSKTFTAVFMNTSDSTQTASFQLSANIMGSATSPLAAPVMLSPVPEPESIMMALTGLAGIGLVLARRRRH